MTEFNIDKEMRTTGEDVIMVWYYLIKYYFKTHYKTFMMESSPREKSINK